MSGAGGMDVRLPIGGLFAILGILLVGYGIATHGDATIYAPSLMLNINLWWGIVMLVFGLLMLLLSARAARSTVLPASASPEGIATEAREHRRGLEH